MTTIFILVGKIYSLIPCIALHENSGEAAAKTGGATRHYRAPSISFTTTQKSLDTSRRADDAVNINQPVVEAPSSCVAAGPAAAQVVAARRRLHCDASTSAATVTSSCRRRLSACEGLLSIGRHIYRQSEDTAQTAIMTNM